MKMTLVRNIINESVKKVSIKFKDYRDIDKQYTNIASIEMFEAVGKKYWENYFEISGSQLNDNLYYKLGRGQNRDILETMRYYIGKQQDRIIHSSWEYDTTYIDLYGYEYKYLDYFFITKFKKKIIKIFN